MINTKDDRETTHIQTGKSFFIPFPYDFTERKRLYTEPSWGCMPFLLGTESLLLYGQYPHKYEWTRKLTDVLAVLADKYSYSPEGTAILSGMTWHPTDASPLEVSTLFPSMHVIFAFTGNMACPFQNGSLYFDSAVVPQMTVMAMIHHFECLLQGMLNGQNGNTPLAEMEFLTPDEKKRLLHDFNRTDRPYPADLTVPQLFALQVTKTPDHVAVVYGEESLTYWELDAAANRLGNYLFQGKGLTPEALVGLLLDRGITLVVAILGVLKAGCTYVPIDPQIPLQRIRFILRDTGIKIVLGEKKYSGKLNRLQWECPDFNAFLLLDSMAVYGETEPEHNQFMGLELWEHVGTTATDEITGGGWLSSYTGLPFTAQEMAEYGNNTLEKLQPLLHGNMRVLEIGTASGITMYRIAPLVGFYLGTDLSRVMVEKNRAHIHRLGFQNIEMACLAAHEIDQITGNVFDLIIINSVIQCFHGHNYLRAVLRKAIALLSTRGWIYCGDVMDVDLKEELSKDLLRFKSQHSHEGFTTKTDVSGELFVGRGFFRDLRQELPGLVEVTCSTKIHTLKNELTEFRYDALLHIDKKAGKTVWPAKEKNQEDARALKPYSNNGEVVAHLGGADNAAYIIYTSGSTGQPKGVIVQHRGIASLSTVFQKNFGILAQDRVLQFASVSFDASVSELVMSLLTGATLCLLDNETITDLNKFTRYLNRMAITVATLPPMYLKLLEHEALGGLRVLITAGSAASRELVDTWRKKLHYINAYGPTETTICTSLWNAPQHGPAQQTVPIGTPIANLKVYILDRYLKLLPMGVPGELCVSGFPVARGYLNRPELTAAKFPPLPIHLRSEGDNLTVVSVPFYRTGDLARWLPDGNLEFLGRLDQQVKVRGFRIEPGEIENRVLLFNDIKAVAVIGWDNTGEAVEIELCAYFETHSGQPVDEVGLRAFLAETLPDYMIPAYVQQMVEIPLTRSGKVNRHLLPKPSLKGRREGYVAPQPGTEAKMAALWAEILGVDAGIIGSTDNFFHLGGHSLKATRLLTAIHKVFGVKIPMAKIFATPTVEQLARATVAANGTCYRPIPPVELKEYYPQSSAQKRLYVLHCLAPESTGYNVQVLDNHRQVMARAHLESLFKTLIARHESLRSSFHMWNNEPVQRIHAEVPFTIEMYYSSEGRTEMAERRTGTGARAPWSKEDRRKMAVLDIQKQGADSDVPVETIIKHFVRPFDLTRAPLLRVGLITIRGQRQVLLVDMHHIISDGVSIAILLNELKILESGGVLPPVLLFYRDFSQWAADAGEASAIKSQERYWLKEMAGPIPRLDLTADHGVGHAREETENTFYFNVGALHIGILKALAREEGATLFMILLAVYTMVLAKLSRQEDVIVGTVTAGRKHADLQTMIGVFLNTLAIRNYPCHDKTFRYFLREVKERTVAAFDNQEYPFETLVGRLDLPRDTTDNPLLDVAFVLQNQMEKTGYIQEVLTQGVSTPYHFSLNQAKYKLTLLGIETEEGVQFSLEYDNTLFSQATVARFSQYYKTAVASVCDFSYEQLGFLAIIPEPERHQLLEEFNGTAFTVPVPLAQQTLHHLFTEQVHHFPDTVVIWGPSLFSNWPIHMSYRQLDAEAQRLALVLTAKGIGPGRIAALLFERSVEMIIGLIAILKAGGGYLPLDPGYPEERLHYMLADSAVPLVITAHSANASGHDLNKLNQWPGEWIFISAPPSANESLAAPVREQRVPSGPADPAYIIYTSGTSGRPKGVLIDNRSAVNTLTFRQNVYDMNASFKVLQLFSYAFDGFVTSFFTPLIAQARVFLLSDRALRDIQLIKDVIVKQKITHFISVPALYGVILESLSPCELSSLRVVTLAGDVLPAHLLTLTREKNPRLEIAHEYGVTEAAVLSTIYRHQELDPIIRIGTPIGNTGVLILDAQAQLQPIGVAGELHITGAGIARGYLNRPELTAAKFVASTLIEGGTMYKTGDLARRLADGTIQFLGRSDQQVKIKGFRIEPAEIETQLLSHTAIKEAVVLARQDKNGEKYLCAYYVPLQAAHTGKEPELWPSIAEFFVYDELLYYAMTHDELRNDSYKAAIRRLVKDRVVVEIGTGQDAILAQFCVAAGATKIYAIEMLADSFKKAQRKIQSLGLEDKIILIHGDATQINLPEKADICLSEIVGSIGGSEGAAVIINKTRRFLKEDGLMIPSRSITKIAAVYLPDNLYREPTFQGVPAQYVDKIFKHLGYPFDLRLCIRNFPTSHIISNDDIFEHLDYTTFTPEESTHEIRLVIHKNALLDGFLIWLTLETMAGEKIDTLAHEYCWLPVYVPAFYPGIAVSAGDVITAQCIRTLCENKLNPDFQIRGFLLPQQGQAIPFNCQLPHFQKAYRETPFYQRLFSPHPIPPTNNNDSGVDAAQLRDYLAQRLPLYMIPAYFIQMAALPLTGTGKLDRGALTDPKADHQTGLITPNTTYQPPQNKYQQLLADVWQQELGIDKIGIDDDFFALGGDSIKALQMVSRLHKSRVTLEANRLFLYKTIRELARFVEPMDVDLTAGHAEEQGIISGTIPLTPIQVWFFRNHGQQKHRLTQSALLYKSQRWDEKIVRKAVTRLLFQHDALRMEYDTTGSWVIQRNRHLEGELFRWDMFSLAHLEKKEFQSVMKREIHRQELLLDKPVAPLVRVGLFKGKEGDWLVFTIHHLVVDGVSWRIILEDFLSLYQQVQLGQEIVLPDKTTSFKQWSQQLASFAQSSILAKEIPYWQALEETTITPLPVDFPGVGQSRKFKDYDVLTLTLTETQTAQLLSNVHGAYHTQINDILLAVVGSAIARWAAVPAVVFALESHGRMTPMKGVDLSRTVGWFTTTYPVVLDIQNTEDIALVIKTVKETLRRVPHQGIGHSILQYLTPGKKRGALNFSLKPQILFNYLGQFNEEYAEKNPAFTPASALSNEFSVTFRDGIHPDYENDYLMVIEGVMRAHQFIFSFHYYRPAYKKETIESFMRIVREKFTRVIRFCLDKDQGEKTPSDLGYVKMPLHVLPLILADIKKNNGPEAQVVALYPLSPMQKEMFFATLADQHAYFIQNLFSLPAPIDHSALEKSFNLLREKYAVLRTLFVYGYEGFTEPLQAVLKSPRVGEPHAMITVVDISHLSPIQQEREVAQYKKADQERGFDLSIGPLWRVVRFITGCSVHILLWSLHHSIVDGWCIGIIIAELSRVYNRLMAGTALVFQAAEPYRSYIDYLADLDVQKARYYWRSYLSGYVQPATLSLWRHASDPKPYELQEYYFSFGEPASIRLRRAAAVHQVTLSTLFQCLWGFLLHRWTRTQDVVFGTIVSGRTLDLKDIQSMVGLFLHIIPVRVKTAQSSDFSQVLKQVHLEALQSRFYETAPLQLAEIMAESLPEQNPPDHVPVPIVDNIMIFENYPRPEPDVSLAQLQLQLTENHEQMAYSFCFYIVPEPSIRVRFSFDGSIYTRETVEKIATDFKEIAGTFT